MPADLRTKMKQSINILVNPYSLSCITRALSEVPCVVENLESRIFDSSHHRQNMLRDGLKAAEKKLAGPCGGVQGLALPE